jgi:hypothetical protein
MKATDRINPTTSTQVWSRATPATASTLSSDIENIGDHDLDDGVAEGLRRGGADGRVGRFGLDGIGPCMIRLLLTQLAP